MEPETRASGTKDYLEEGINQKRGMK